MLQFLLIPDGNRKWKCMTCMKIKQGSFKWQKKKEMKDYAEVQMSLL
jgi:hypothetical protein